MSLLILIVKATLILVGALGVTLVMQRAAAGARHLVWLVTLGALLFIPVLTLWSPIHLRILPALATTSASLPNTDAAETPPYSAALTAPGAANSLRSPAAQPADAPRTSVTTSVSGVVAHMKDTNPLTILLVAWLAVALAIAASLGYAALSLRRIVRNSVPLTGREWLDTVWEISDRIGLEKAPRLLQSRETKMPFACGTLHPTIVLPVESEGWSPERRSAVLLHELAHVRRKDLVGHTLGRIACAVYWFHPLVWTAAKRLRSESERACDDLALMCGTRPADYAEHLLEIVTSVRGDRTPMVALAMARRKEFEGRMLAILDPLARRSIPSRWKTGALVGSLGVLSIVVGAAAPMPRVAPATQSHVANASAVEASHLVVKPQVTAAPRVAPPSSVADRPDGHDAGNRLVEGAAQFGLNVASDILSRVQAGLPLGRKMNASGSISDGQMNGEARNPLSSFDANFDSKTPDERAELLARVLGTDTNADLRRTAAWGLSKYAENPVASAALTRALLHDANASVREMAAWALARDRDAAQSSSSALATALRGDASDSVRATAAWALGSIRDDASAPALTAALADRSADVRSRAVWALGSLRPKSAPSAMVAKLSDSDPEVRQLAAWALFRIRDTTAIPALQAALRTETNKDLQVDYVRALGAMGEKSLNAIRGLLESPDPRIKSVAVDALAGGDAAGPWPWPWPEPRPYP
ncbi:MAG TPA: HEAT repeat domain-containing protein [Gemmatimonadaceae bacterium]|nr:HEAT repeat domain-containing protein [Gemmatimonadaceae bacterium]